MRFAVLGLLFALSTSAYAADAPVQVMIVGGFHMNNPGLDMHDLAVDDVLAPRRQAEIEGISQALLRFHPTMVDAEWPAYIAAQRYDAYLKGTLAPSHNEVVQLGFRLAHEAGLSTVHGIDVDGEFPYDAVQTYAQAHGQSALLDEQDAAIVAMVKRQADLLSGKGISATLRYLNDPAVIAHGNDFYRTTLKVGGGANQPGADLLTAWYRRNFQICARLIQLAHPGDRVVVFYGSGHALLLRQCVQETPGFQLVEANDYLPQ
jgi:hypothetical protein